MDKKLFYILSVVLSLVVSIAIFVIAYGGDDPLIFGHSAGELHVNGTSIIDGSIGADDIADGAINASKIDFGGGCPAGQSIRNITSDGTVVCEVDDYAANTDYCSGGSCGDLDTGDITLQYGSSIDWRDGERVYSASATLHLNGGAYAIVFDDAISVPSCSGCTDIAEYINASENEILEAGDVLVIDKTKRIHVTKSSKPYQHNVAGVFTTTPGYLMGNPDGTLTIGGDMNFTNYSGTMHGGNVPMALAGQVPIKATAENGPIEIGDLLTTSSTPGYAMRCDMSSTEGKLTCMGAVVGKALEPLESGSGKIVGLLGIQ